MKRLEFTVAPGGLEELRANGIELREKGTWLPLREATAAQTASPGAAIIGMRSRDPGREVPGTRHGYTCARCGDAMRLAPSGQRLAAEGVATWCIACLPFLGGAPS